MHSEAERQAFNVCAPSQTATEGAGITILAATTSAAHAAVPDTLFNRYAYFQAVGDDIWLTFGPTSSGDVDSSKAGGATFAAGADVGNGMLLKNGTLYPFRLLKGRHDYIKWQANAGNAKLIVWSPSQPGRL